MAIPDLLPNLLCPVLLENLPTAVTSWVSEQKLPGHCLDWETCLVPGGYGLYLPKAA